MLFFYWIFTEIHFTEDLIVDPHQHFNSATFINLRKIMNENLLSSYKNLKGKSIFLNKTFM